RDSADSSVAEDVATPVEAPVAVAGRLDLYGASLPPGALVRMGTVCFRHAGLRCSSVAFSPDGEILASAGADKAVRLWEAATGKEIRSLAHPHQVEVVAFSTDGKVLASGCHDNTVRIWEAATGKEIHSLTGHKGRVDSLAFSRDGRFLASGGDGDALVRLWE